MEADPPPPPPPPPQPPQVRAGVPCKADSAAEPWPGGADGRKRTAGFGGFGKMVA